MQHRLVVFGGSGLVGSCICKLAVARGWAVTSLSRSGTPFATPQGSSPAWVERVNWKRATPFDEASYAQDVGQATAVVSTLGILLEHEYKRRGAVDPLSLVKGLVAGWTGDQGNPLVPKTGRTYESMNRDAALHISRTFASTSDAERKPFVMISAEDIFRPLVPARYIETKREAERIISAEAIESGKLRPIFARPSLIYHPHLAPLSTLPATLLDASSKLNALLPTPLRLAPDHARLTSLPSLLSIPPIHAESVARAVLDAIEDEDAEGVMGVSEMRARLGFDDEWDKAQPPVASSLKPL